jgi:hypothetical protein
VACTWLNERLQRRVAAIPKTKKSGAMLVDCGPVAWNERCFSRAFRGKTSGADIGALDHERSRVVGWDCQGDTS